MRTHQTSIKPQSHQTSVKRLHTRHALKPKPPSISSPAIRCAIRCLSVVQIKKFPSVFSDGECDQLWDSAAKAASARGGWHGDRHHTASTTDIKSSQTGAETDSFIRQRLSTVLVPQVRLAYHSPNRHSPDPSEQASNGQPQSAR